LFAKLWVQNCGFPHHPPSWSISLNHRVLRIVLIFLTNLTQNFHTLSGNRVNVPKTPERTISEATHLDSLHGSPLLIFERMVLFSEQHNRMVPRYCFLNAWF
jgi:hypothetical protein